MNGRGRKKPGSEMKSACDIYRAMLAMPKKEQCKLDPHMLAFSAESPIFVQQCMTMPDKNIIKQAKQACEKLMAPSIPAENDSHVQETERSPAATFGRR